MKNLRANMNMGFDRLNERWSNFLVGKQRRYTLYFFAGYLLLTAGVIFEVWYDTTKPHNNLVIEHIDNPVFRKQENPAFVQDTLVTILKKK